MKLVHVNIVTWNSADCIQKCLESVLSQDLMPARIVVIDNNSSDSTVEILTAKFGREIQVIKNSENLGFSAAHNQGLKIFFDSSSELCLTLNPDVLLRKDFLSEIVRCVEAFPESGLFTPKLLRADDQLNPMFPAVLDAAGMVLDLTLRHFDRGSEELDRGQYENSEIVFGGTGAALLMTRESVAKLVLSGSRYDKDKGSIYPQLLIGDKDRMAVFDEAFFAYREDAELCWRAGNQGISTMYCPRAVALHRRVVLPERRSALPPSLNMYSVRNRFLMQIVNFSFARNFHAILPGLIFRNLLVIIAVIVKEWSSIQGLLDVFRLWRRARERRHMLRDAKAD